MNPPASRPQPRPRPVYDHPSEKMSGFSLRQVFSLALVENLFFAAALVFSFLFAFVVLRQGISSWTNVAYLLAVWVVVSYLALPRLHRILTTLYVPDYFIGRARTSDGLLGDPVNLALLGSADQIHTAMREAGWIEADPVDLASSVRIVLASLTRRSYDRAPVSPLLLFGQQQAFAYQQEVEGNPAQRHHVRFWPCPAGWLLPGGHRVDWLAAGTYDRSVGLSLFTGQVTHKIDREIDIERDYIVDSMLAAEPRVSVSVIEDFSTGYHSRNGGGDAVVTDGDLPIVNVREVELPEGVAVGASPDDPVEGSLALPTGATAARPSASQQAHDLLDEVGRRPFSVVAGSALVGVSFLLALVLAASDVQDMIATDAEIRAEAGLFAIGVALTVLILYIPLGWLTWRMYLGSQTARLFMLAFLSVSQLSQLAQWVGRDRPPFITLLAMTVDLLAVYALTSLSARQWTAQWRRSRLERRRARRGR